MRVKTKCYLTRCSEALQLRALACHCGAGSAKSTKSPRDRDASRAAASEIQTVPESKHSFGSPFNVEQGGAAQRDPKEAAARGWAKLRSTVKSAKMEAQGTVGVSTVA